MDEVAILIDAPYMIRCIQEREGGQSVSSVVEDCVYECLTDNEQLFRVYIYDSKPYGKSEINPYTKDTIHFGQTNRFHSNLMIQENLKRTDRFVFRYGTLLFTGWGIKEQAVRELVCRNRSSIDDSCIQPKFKQKHKDVLMVMDIMHLVANKTVDCIYVCTMNTDYVPVLKYAQDHGIITGILTLGNRAPDYLVDVCDVVRTLHFIEGKWQRRDDFET